MGSQIYTRLPPCEGVWPVGGRASGYTPSQVPSRGGATSCLPRQLHLLTTGANVPAVAAKRGRHRRCTDANATSPVSRPTQRREGRECVRYWSLSPRGAGACACHGIEQGHVQRDIYR
jgi:hypothetical protein